MSDVKIVSLNLNKIDPERSLAAWGFQPQKETPEERKEIEEQNQRLREILLGTWRK